MRYLLVVGFSCDVYRQEPRARIFVGDQLIDDFHIPHTPDNLRAINKFFTNLHLLQPFSVSEADNVIIKNRPPLRFYELDINEEIKNLTLSINIDNSDSNYSNGFMTSSTLIKLKTCAFFPFSKRVLLKLNKIKNKNRLSKNYSWYRMHQNLVFDLVRNGMCWKGANGQFFANTVSLLDEESIGGNGDFICQLVKKYGILMPTLARACRHTFSYSIMNYFFDKYQQHAHQRDSD